MSAVAWMLRLLNFWKLKLVMVWTDKLKNSPHICFILQEQEEVFRVEEWLMQLMMSKVFFNCNQGTVHYIPRELTLYLGMSITLFQKEEWCRFQAQWKVGPDIRFVSCLLGLRYTHKICKLSSRLRYILFLYLKWNEACVCFAYKNIPI